MPRVEATFAAKSSAPKTSMCSPTLVVSPCPEPCVRVSLSGVEVTDHDQEVMKLPSLEPPVVKAGSPGAPWRNPYPLDVVPLCTYSTPGLVWLVVKLSFSGFHSQSGCGKLPSVVRLPSASNMLARPVLAV